MTVIVVYSLPDLQCYQCKMTKKVLTDKGFVDGVDYRVVNVIDEPEEGDRLRDEGHRQMPVVKTPEGDVWAGFRPDKIGALERPSGGGATLPA